MVKKNCEECGGRLIRCAECVLVISRLEARLGQHNFIGYGVEVSSVSTEEVADIKYYHGPEETVR
jgi:hypothetical protein